MKHTLSQKQIGKKIRELRKKTGKTGDAVAKGIGISRQHLYQLEVGNRGLTVARLNCLMSYFRVSLEELTNGRKKAS